MDTKSEIKVLLIGWLMGVEQNSVFLSRILVVGCVGLSDCEKNIGSYSQEMMGLVLVWLLFYPIFPFNILLFILPFLS